MAKGGLRRLIAELRGAVAAEDGDAALARLSVKRTTSDAALVELVGGAVVAGEPIAQIAVAGQWGAGAERISDLQAREVAVVSIGRNVYTRVPTAEARVRLLEAARRAARTAVVVHVPVIDDGSHLGRVAIDAPRAVLRAAGLPVAEPGDRFLPRYTHGFFDEEALLGELARAGLAVTKRHGFRFLTQPAVNGTRAEDADPFVTELRRVVQMVREVDRERKNESPQQVLAAMRARGAGARERGPIGRARLRRAVGWTDALLPGSPSCYRRVLLEVALDGGAARETVVFGLDVGSTGHVAFENREERLFDVSFTIPPSSATRP